MDTNGRQFQRIDVDDKAGELIGVDEEHFLTRFPRTDWKDQNKDTGNWEKSVEELAKDLNVTHVEHDDGIRLAIDIQKASGNSVQHSMSSKGSLKKPRSSSNNRRLGLRRRKGWNK